MNIKNVLIVLLLFLSGCDKQTDQGEHTQPAIEVNVMTLKTESITLTTQLPARVTAVRTAEVRPQVSGIIEQKLFIEGSEIAANQPLYQIDPDTYQAAYDRAQATLTNAMLLEARYKKLVNTNFVSRQNYDDALAARREAEADLKSAKVNLDYTTITAPISGHVGRSLVTEGALVQNGQGTYLTIIQQLDPIYVDIPQSSLQLLKIRRDKESGKLKLLDEHRAMVTLQLEDGTAYEQEGSLEIYEVTVDETTGSVTMRALFPNPKRELLPGMFVHVTIPQGINSNGILAPQESISRDTRGRPFVYIVNAENLIEQRMISTGQMHGDKWIVYEGLNEGDQIVISGLQNIREGSRVTPIEAQPSALATMLKTNLSMIDTAAQ